MKKFLDELFVAEFGYEQNADFVTQCYGEPNPKKMIELLTRASEWTTYNNLVKVCCYIGSECDERIGTVKGCQEIIKEDIEYWKGEV